MQRVCVPGAQGELPWTEVCSLALYALGDGGDVCTPVFGRYTGGLSASAGFCVVTGWNLLGELFSVM